MTDPTPLPLDDLVIATSGIILGPEPLEGIIVTGPDETGQLVTVEKRPIFDLFTTPAVVEALLGRVRELATKDFTPDTSTDAGRKEIGRRARRVASTKTYLEGLGVEEAARLKLLPNQLDAGRRWVKSSLELIQVEIRKPLTDWEARVEAIRARLSAIQNLPTTHFQSTAVQIQDAIVVLDLTATDEATWDEFAKEAGAIVTVTLATLQEMMEKAKKREDDAAELERLRIEKAENDRKAREEEIRRAAAEKATKEAEAQLRAKQESAQKREAEAKLAQERAERQLEDERRNSAAREEAARVQAVDDERRRVAMVPSGVQAIQERQADPTPAAPITQTVDLEHQKDCHRQALEDVIAALAAAPMPLSTEDPHAVAAKAVMTAIYQKKVRHVQIVY